VDRSHSCRLIGLWQTGGQVLPPPNRLRTSSSPRSPRNGWNTGWQPSRWKSASSSGWSGPALGGATAKLLEILDHWTKTGKDVKPISVNQAVAEFVEYKSAGNLDRGTLSDLSYRLGDFARAFDATPLHGITAREVDKYLREKPEGWSRKSFWKRLSPFFAHAVRQCWCLINVLDELDPPQVKRELPSIYTPYEYGQLLKTAAAEDGDPEILLYLIRGDGVSQDHGTGQALHG
jgi:hypothetical protein